MQDTTIFTRMYDDPAHITSVHNLQFSGKIAMQNVLNIMQLTGKTPLSR